MQRLVWGIGSVFSLLVACGGSQPAVEAPATGAEETAAEPAPTPPAEGAEETTKGDEPKAPEKKPDEAAAEPAFTENMSVADATKAVPQGAERKNIEQEALAKPLQDPATFEACKVGTAHYKVKIAVWNGKAVGIDLTTTPKNQKLVDCLTTKIKELTWPDKVKSLNTVEYQY